MTQQPYAKMIARAVQEHLHQDTGVKPSYQWILTCARTALAENTDHAEGWRDRLTDKLYDELSKTNKHSR